MSRGAKVNKATLELNLTFKAGSSPKDKVVLYPLTTPWKEKEVTFTNASDDTQWDHGFTGIFGGDISGGGDINTDYRVVSSRHKSINDWVTFDVTEIVKEMVKNPDTFHGFVIGEGFIPDKGKVLNDDGDPNYPVFDTAGSYNKKRYYYSSDYEEREQRPRLRLDITPDAILHQSLKANEAISIFNKENALTLFNGRDSELRIQLFTVQGRAVSSITLRAGQSETLQTTNFAKGVYLLKISDRSGTRTKHIVIK